MSQSEADVQILNKWKKKKTKKSLFFILNSTFVCLSFTLFVCSYGLALSQCSVCARMYYVILCNFIATKNFFFSFWQEFRLPVCDPFAGHWIFYQEVLFFSSSPSVGFVEKKIFHFVCSFRIEEETHFGFQGNFQRFRISLSKLNHFYNLTALM